MIISHQHKFIFVAIPKTATHAIRGALRPHLGKYDWEQCSLFEQKTFPIPNLAKSRHGHLNIEEVRHFFPKNALNNYFKFCFIRNPLERFISACNFWHRNSSIMEKAPLDTMKSMIYDKAIRGRILFKPQANFIQNKFGELNVDFIGNYYAINRDFSYICRIINLGYNTLETINKTKIKKIVFDTELKEAVEHYYSIDYQLIFTKKLNP